MKTKSLYFILVGGLIFFTLSRPVSGSLYSLAAFLFLLSCVLMAPAIARSGIIQSGYKKMPHWLIKLLMLVYCFGMHQFSRAWLENLQHSLWDLIVDNLTDIFAVAFVVIYLVILLGSLKLHRNDEDTVTSEDLPMIKN